MSRRLEYETCDDFDFKSREEIAMEYDAMAKDLRAGRVLKVDLDECDDSSRSLQVAIASNLRRRGVTVTQKTMKRDGRRTLYIKQKE